MLKLTVSNTIAIQVRGTLPREDGSAQPFDYTLVCSRMSAEEFRAKGEAPGGVDMIEFMRGVVQDWRSVADEAGQPLPFSDEGLSALLNITGMASVAYYAYIDGCSAKGKAKN
jgi:hypothetical protein